MSVSYSWIGPTKDWLGPLYLGVAKNQEMSAFTNHIPSSSNQSVLKEINPEYTLEEMMLKLKIQ